MKLHKYTNRVLSAYSLCQFFASPYLVLVPLVCPALVLFALQRVKILQYYSKMVNTYGTIPTELGLATNLVSLYA